MFIAMNTKLEYQPTQLIMLQLIVAFRSSLQSSDRLQHIIRAGCSAHTSHNAIKHGIGFQDAPVERVVTLIYNHFSSSAAQIESLGVHRVCTSGVAEVVAPCYHSMAYAQACH